MRKVNSTVAQQSWALNQGLIPLYDATSCEGVICVIGEDSKEGMTPFF